MALKRWFGRSHYRIARIVSLIWYRSLGICSLNWTRYIAVTSRKPHVLLQNGKQWIFYKYGHMVQNLKIPKIGQVPPCMNGGKCLPNCYKFSFWERAVIRLGRTSGITVPHNCYRKVFLLTANSISLRKINFITAKLISPRQSQFHHGKIIVTQGKISFANLPRRH